MKKFILFFFFVIGFYLGTWGSSKFSLDSKVEEDRLVSQYDANKEIVIAKNRTIRVALENYKGYTWKINKLGLLRKTREQYDEQWQYFYFSCPAVGATKLIINCEKDNKVVKVFSVNVNVQ